MSKLGSALLIAGSLIAASAAFADTVAVPGTANPFYAGRSDTGGDGTVPPQSTVAVVPGAILTFKVTGGASYVGGCPSSCYPLDGTGQTSMTNLDTTTGIAGIDNAPAAALVGVFLNNKTPNPPAPSRLNFAVTGKDFTKFRAHLRQMFFIGDGRNDSGKRQRFIVPKGATRLFLGVSDGSGWYNNSGEIDATITQTTPP